MRGVEEQQPNEPKGFKVPVVIILFRIFWHSDALKIRGMFKKSVHADGNRSCQMPDCTNHAKR